MIAGGRKVTVSASIGGGPVIPKEQFRDRRNGT
jgi:hypothetical protein